jgi:hypothetical protein
LMNIANGALLLIKDIWNTEDEPNKGIAVHAVPRKVNPAKAIRYLSYLGYGAPGLRHDKRRSS